MWPPLIEFLEALVAMMIFWGILVLSAVVLVLVAFGLNEVIS